MNLSLSALRRLIVGGGIAAFILNLETRWI